MSGKARIAVLVSGGGTNLQAILDAAARGEIPDGEVAMVISDRAGAYALERAQKAGVPIYLSYIDWNAKKAGIGIRVETTGDFNADMAKIFDFYRGMRGMYKGHFNLEQGL